jgi:hypothetical protein
VPGFIRPLSRLTTPTEQLLRGEVFLASYCALTEGTRICISLAAASASVTLTSEAR